METETFVSENGYYVIKQEDLLEEDQIVALTPEQMKHIVSDMQAHLADQNWFSAVVIEE